MSYPCGCTDYCLVTGESESFMSHCKLFTPLFTENSLLADVNYVLCLDSLGQGNSLNLHVSKPPKEGSSGDLLYKVSPYPMFKTNGVLYKSVGSRYKALVGGQI